MLVLCLGLLTVCDIWGLERESNYLLLIVMVTVLSKLAHQEYLKYKVRQLQQSAQGESGQGEKV